MRQLLLRIPAIVTLAAFWTASLASARAHSTLLALALTILAVCLLFLGRAGLTHGAVGILAILLASARVGLGPGPIQVLDDAMLDPNPASVVGTVQTQPQIHPSGLTFTLQTEQASVSSVWHPVNLKVFVRYAGYQELEAGSRVYLRGILRQAPDPHSGSFGLWLEQQGLRYTMWAYSSQNLGPTTWDPFQDIRHRLRQAVLASFPDPEAGVLLGLTMGDTSRITPTVRSWFANTGTAHFLALSGWNVSLMAGLVMALLTPLAGRRWAALAAVWGIVAFVAVVGPQPSVLRAGIMGALAALAVAFGRGYSSLATLSAAAVLMTLLDPDSLEDLGFRLSFTATLGIVLLGPMLRIQKLPKAVSDTLAATLAAELAVSPLVIATFGKISTISPLANLALAPMLPACVLLGTGTAISGLLSLELARVLAWMAWLPSTGMLRALEALASVPTASVSVEFPPTAVLFFYVGLAGLGFTLWQRNTTAALLFGGATAGLALGLLLTMAVL